MQESDGKGFERAIARLCAAFDVPVTDARREAYWRSFRKLPLLEFAGLVDMALVESTFASMPTVGALWELHRKIQPHQPSQQQRGPTIHERLCAYAAKTLHSRLTPTEFSRPWRYIEGVGLIIDLENCKQLNVSVAELEDDAA